MTDLQTQAAAHIDANRAALSEMITARHYHLHPELTSRYGPVGVIRCREDAAFHLSYLAQALTIGNAELFVDYIAWAKVMLNARRVTALDLAHNLDVLKTILSEQLPPDLASAALGYVDAGGRALPSLPEEVPCMIKSDAPLAALAQQYISALLRYDRMAATKLVLDALNGGTPMRDIYEHVFASVQREIGRLWQVNKLTVAEEHYCTAASQLIISQLYPYMFRAPKNGRTMVGMCTTGDLHEMGVRMVCDFFEMEGWDTMYLGANVPLSSALQMLRKRKPQILALSATIPYHVSSVGEVIAALRHDPQFDNIKVLVGGYAFCKPDLWRSVGADAYGRSAAEAVELANSLVS